MTETFVCSPPVSSPIARNYAKSGNKAVADSAFDILILSDMRDQKQIGYANLCRAAILRRAPGNSMHIRNKKQQLSDALPAFAAELQRLLTEAGESELAAQVPSLGIFGRCDCGDDFCGTFYTKPKPKGSYGPGHRNVALTPDEGMLILDVVAGEIACVEVLDRKEVREKLDALLP